MKSLRALLLFLFAISLPAVGWTQGYPARPLHFVIGFTPGALTDGIARVVAQEMEKTLGQPIVLEFRPGANGTIAARHVASSNPDGYTFFFGSTLPMHPIFALHNAVDAEKQLVAISRAATQPFYFMSSAKLPVRTYQELVAYQKRAGRQVTQGSSTALQDLVMEVLRQKSGLDTMSIPFKGSGEVATALLAGDVDVTIGGVLSYLPHVQAGKARLLFVASRQRSALLPDVPSAPEAGLPDVEAGLDYGLWAPVGIPADIRLKIGSAMASAVRKPEITAKIRALNGDPDGSTPEEAARGFSSAVRFWKAAAETAGFRPR